MTTVALIPARGGSKRLPRKNVMMFAGRPLIYYSIAAAQAVPQIDRCLVSTEDEEIAAVAREYGAEVIERPGLLASDTATSASVAVHALETIGRTQALPDALVLLQPNCPLRPPALIADAIALLANGESDSVVSVTPHHLKIGTIERDRFVPEYGPGTRSQDMPPKFYENGLVYATRSSVLIEQHSIFGARVRPLVVDSFYGMGDIDTAFDFALTEWLFETHRQEFEWCPRP